MQRYRFDKTGEPCPNGSVPVYAEWMGGPSLAGIRACPVDEPGVPPRVVYVQGEPDTFFSIPAACRIRGKYRKGWIGCDENGYVFHPNAPKVAE